MKKIIDGIVIQNGRKIKEFTPSLMPVIKGFAEILGDDLINQYLHECLGEEAMFYPGYSEIGLGNSKGWAKLQDEKNLVNYIISKLEVKIEYNHKGFVGRHDYIICK